MDPPFFNHQLQQEHRHCGNNEPSKSVGHEPTSWTDRAPTLPVRKKEKRVLVLHDMSPHVQQHPSTAHNSCTLSLSLSDCVVVLYSVALTWRPGGHRLISSHLTFSLFTLTHSLSLSLTLSFSLPLTFSLALLLSYSLSLLLSLSLSLYSLSLTHTLSLTHSLSLTLTLSLTLLTYSHSLFSLTALLLSYSLSLLSLSLSLTLSLSYTLSLSLTPSLSSTYSLSLSDRITHAVHSTSHVSQEYGYTPCSQCTFKFGSGPG